MNQPSKSPESVIPLTRADVTALGLKLIWIDGFEAEFHAIWLRDNCRCNACGEPAIGRRTLRLSEMDLGIQVLSAGVMDAAQGDSIEICWSDNHCGLFNAGWLRRHAYDDESRKQRQFKPVLWNREFINDPPILDYDRIMSSDYGLIELLTTLQNSGFTMLRGARAKAGTAEKFARRIGYIQESNFGRVMDLIADRRHRSIANDSDALKPHTDEPYRASPPGIIVFHCVETDVSGAGYSLFLDGFEAAETLRREDLEGFRALTRHNQRFRRFFDDDVDLIAEFPVISTDEFDNVSGVRVNDRVAAPASIDPDQMTVYYRGMQRFLQLVEDENRMIKINLQPGDIAVFDNHRVLHGRTRLTFQGRRWLQWVQVERGDFYSSLRIISDRLNIERSDLPLLRGAY